MNDLSQPRLKLNLPALHDRLRYMFKTNFTAIDIAESLLIFEQHRPASEAKKILRGQNRDVAGVVDQGQIVGYVIRAQLDTGSCADHVQAMSPDGVLDYKASYQDIIEVLSRSEYCFLTFLGQIAGVIQKRDMMKPSVRMWLFGLITMVEMILSSMLEHFYPNDSWQTELPQARLDKARSLLTERRRIGQELELKDCLYFVDKASILTKNPSIREELGFESRTEVKQVISKFESLRNSLAHTHDIVTYDWKAIVEIARSLDRMLSRF